MAIHRVGPALLQLTVVQTGVSTVAIAFSGDVDASNIDHLRTTIIETLDQHHPTSIALDLSGLTFIDLAGARALYKLRAELAVAECVLSISHAQRHVRWMLCWFGLETTFPEEVAGRGQYEPRN